VVPLGLYLLSFILTFESSRWYVRKAWMAAFALAPLVLLVVWNEGSRQVGLPALIGLCGLVVLAGCMVCHGEAARLRPRPAGLTRFYLLLSAGGAAGGFFVAIVAPNVFAGHNELHVALGAVWVMMAYVELRDEAGRYSWRNQRRRAMILAACAAFGVIVMTVQAGKLGEGQRVRVRNFYGSLSVGDADGVRTLRHGAVVHGRQYVEEGRRREALSYYCPEGGIGLAMRETAGRPREIGILGLGAGALAAYGRRGDRMRFYEINPLVEKLAREEFWFLRGSEAETSVRIGDGRLELQRERDLRLDVLALDAFSGDAVPVHLMTEEAFAMYETRLRPEGVLAVHVSNNYLDLAPVAAAAARSVGRVARLVENAPDAARRCEPTTWVLAVKPEHALAKAGREVAPGRAWRDDYSSLWGVVRWGR
jgi:hypothetical protein